MGGDFGWDGARRTFAGGAARWDAMVRAMGGDGAGDGRGSADDGVGRRTLALEVFFFFF